VRRNKVIYKCVFDRKAVSTVLYADAVEDKVNNDNKTDS